MRFWGSADHSKLWAGPTLQCTREKATSERPGTTQVSAATQAGAPVCQPVQAPVAGIKGDATRSLASVSQWTRMTSEGKPSESGRACRPRKETAI